MKNQEALMRFDPLTRAPKPYPSHARQYRTHNSADYWNYNPWTGVKRTVEEMDNDPLGFQLSTFDEDLRNVPLWYLELKYDADAMKKLLDTNHG